MVRYLSQIQTLVYINLLILFAGWQGYAQPIAVPPQLSRSINISMSTEHYVDSSGTQPFTEIRKAAFGRIQTRNFRIPFSSKVHWFSCTLLNTDSIAQSVFVEWTSPVIEHMELYYIHPELGEIRAQAGNKIADHLRSYPDIHPIFRIELAPGFPTKVYFKNRNDRGYRTDIMLHNRELLTTKQIRSAKVMAFFSGLVSIRLFFVLLLGIFVVKELAFRRYSFMITLRSLGFWGIIGVLGAYFTEDPTLQIVINFLSYHLLPIGYFLLIKSLLPLERFPAFVRKGISCLMIFNVVLGLIILYDYRWQWLMTSIYMVLFCQILIFALYILSVAKKYTINWYYSAPFLLGLSSYFCLLVSLVGWLNFSWVFHAVSFFFVSEIFVFGLFLGKIIINHDLARNKTEKALEAHKLQTQNLQELDRIKSDFFANISHEFRTPLTLLVGPLKDLHERHPDEPMFPLMQRNVERLHKLINQFLDLSKLDAGQVEPQIAHNDLPEFVDRLFASFESLAQSRNIIFHHEQSHQHLLAFFDADKLEKILSNLLSNAFKFTCEQGRINARAVYTDQFLQITVEDNGIGIAEDQLPFIFDRYFQGHSQQYTGPEGSGIGLSLLKELVMVLKGNISVDSTLNKGTIFTLLLPIDAETWQDTLSCQDQSISTHESPTEPSPDTIEINGEVPLILLVEDNPDLRLYLKSIFEEQYEVIQAQHGEEGWQLAITHVPDMVISDIMMPFMNGIQLCEKLKSDSRTSHIPIVLLTAKASLDDRLQGLTHGADDYLGKPFDRNELRARVHNLLGLRQQLQEKYGMMLRDKSERDISIDEISFEGKFLHKAIEIVESNFHDSGFDVTQFCAAMHISRSNLHRKLKALTNQSTTEFIRSLRIYRAAALLRQGELSVSEVAYAVGYESLSYFSKSFKEQIGMLPSEWAQHGTPQEASSSAIK
ncbi:response regulator [Dyadobacter tibetensis]|uniref:response regulator n=1 Tax=Dyadobacter tibetensis TaxID=1211851 RepID=UPI00046F08AB|nr:response regulator [Dyadobacter tibetensis]